MGKTLQEEGGVTVVEALPMWEAEIGQKKDAICAEISQGLLRENQLTSMQRFQNIGRQRKGCSSLSELGH